MKALIRETTKVNGINLFYRDTGPGRPPMLCLHGRWGRGETWIDLISRYRERFRIIAPDQRGHGLSDKPVARYASQDLAADAYELLNALDSSPAILVGHSMGGRIAAHVAALYPEAVRALVILDEGADGPEDLSDTAPQDVSPVDPLTNDWPIPYTTYQEAVQDLSARFKETGVRYFLDSLVETIEGYEFLFSPHAMAALEEYHQDWHVILPQIQCPVLLVRATESWCLSREEADKMLAMIQGCTYFEVDNSDHMVYTDNPDQFYPQFDQFINHI